MRACEILDRLPTDRQWKILQYVEAFPRRNIRRATARDVAVRLKLSPSETRGEITTLILAGYLRYISGDGLERTSAIPIAGEVS
jgi:Mn-dependent DtxR family transcriptional regulator